MLMSADLTEAINNLGRWSTELGGRNVGALISRGELKYGVPSAFLKPWDEVSVEW